MNYNKKKIRADKIDGGWIYSYLTYKEAYALIVKDNGELMAFRDHRPCEQTDIPKEIWRFFNLNINR